MTLTPAQRKTLTELDPDRERPLAERNALAWAELLVDYYRTSDRALVAAGASAYRREIDYRRGLLARAQLAALRIDPGALAASGYPRRGLFAHQPQSWTPSRPARRSR
jgi:hypothetical protein